MAFIRLKLDRPPTHRRHVNSMLERGARPLPVQHAKKVSVQVNRMMHHSIVNQLQADHLAMMQSDHSLLSHGLAIE